MKLVIVLAFSASAVLLGQSTPPLTPDPPHVCDDCAGWNAPRAPFKLFGHSYSVGTAGLSSLLLTSTAGHILIDGGLTQSAPLIAGNIEKLGFRLAEVRLILNSHAHFDHAGGISALQRASKATVHSSPAGIAALAKGGPTPDDPQFGFGPAFNDFPPVTNTRHVGDGEVLTLGELTVTAHHTPGHTPGGMTWSWTSCEGSRCQQLVLADSLSAVSAPKFRFTDGGPARVDQFRRSIAKVAALPCDILVTTHPSAAEGKTCKTLAAEAGGRLDERVAQER